VYFWGIVVINNLTVGEGKSKVGELKREGVFMKKIIWFLVSLLILTSGVFAQTQDESGSNVALYVLIALVVIIAHICLTVAVYKMKGGSWACFYFFLAPVVLFLLFFVTVGKHRPFDNGSSHVHHHFH